MSSVEFPPSGGSPSWKDAVTTVGSLPAGSSDCEVRIACDTKILYAWNAGGAAWVPITFTVASIDHTAILNIGTNSHAQLDTGLSNSVSHIADGTIHFTVGSIDHTALGSGIGTNTHAQLDTGLANSVSHIANTSNPHSVTAVQAGAEPTITGGATTITSANLVSSRALTSSATGKVVVSLATNQELDRLSGLSSNVQTQLNGTILSLNGQAGSANQSQSFSVDVTGTDFNISSSAGNHKFSIPSASATARGLITTGTQTIAGAKTFEQNTNALNFITMKNTTTGVSAAIGLILESDTGAAAGGLLIKYNSAYTGPSYFASALYLVNRANAPMLFGTSNSTRMSITGGGDVGIGTGITDADAKLEVAGTLKVLHVQGTDSAFTGLGSSLDDTYLQKIEDTTGTMALFIGRKSGETGVAIQATTGGSSNAGPLEINPYGGVSTFGGELRTTFATASRALVTNASQGIIASATTAAEMAFVSGVTSAIQTQIDNLRAVNQQVAVAGDVTLTNKALHNVDTTSARSLLLPVVGAGVYLIIKDVSGSAQTNNITITTFGAETIDGAATLVIDGDYAAVTIYSDGTNYFVI